jgi:predicted ester cyclase
MIGRDALPRVRFCAATCDETYETYRTYVSHGLICLIRRVRLQRHPDRPEPIHNEKSEAGASGYFRQQRDRQDLINL